MTSLKPTFIVLRILLGITLLTASLHGCSRIERPTDFVPPDVTGTHVLSCQPSNSNDPTCRIAFTTDEVTWGSVSVDSKAGVIVFDALGHIYEVSIKGGEARRLRGGSDWMHSPVISPSKSQIAFVNDVGDGVHRLWVMDRNGSNARPVSIVGAMSPEWLSEHEIVYLRQSYSSGSYGVGELRVVTVQTGEDKEFLNEPMTGPALNPDSSTLYYASKRRPGSPPTVLSLDLDDLETRRVSEEGAIAFRPAVSPNARYVSYVVEHGRWSHLVIQDQKTGDRTFALRDSPEKTTLGVSQRDLFPRHDYSDDGRAIFAFWDGQLVKYSLESAVTENIPIQVPVERVIRNSARVTPATLESAIRANSKFVKHYQWFDSNATETLEVVQAVGKIWVRKIGNGDSPDEFGRLNWDDGHQYAPAFHPTEDKLLYTTWRDDLGGNVIIDELSTGNRISIDSGVFVVSPTWSPDGAKVAYFRGPKEGMYRGFGSFQLELIVFDLKRGVGEAVQTYVWPSYFQKHVFPIASFSSDGSSIAYMEGTRGGHSLVEVNVATNEKTTLAKYPETVDFVLPSPDRNFVLIGDRSTAYLIGGSTKSEIYDYFQWQFDPMVVTTQLSEYEVIYPRWKDNNTVQWIERSSARRMLADSRNSEIIAKLSIPYPIERGDARPVAFLGATVLSMGSAGVIDDAAILTKGSRIIEVGVRSDVAIPTDALKVDVTGMTIVPGFVDTHGHVTRRESREYMPQVHRRMLAYLAYGVTTTFDPNAMSYDFYVLAEMANKGLALGPRTVTTGQTVWTSYRGGRPAGPVARLYNEHDVDSLVNILKDNGAISIKNYAVDERPIRQLLNSKAKSAGMSVVDEGVYTIFQHLKQVSDGPGAIEHWYLDAHLYDDVRQFLARSGVHHNGTLFSRGSNTMYLQRLSCHDAYLSQKDLKYQFTWQTMILLTQESRDVCTVRLGQDLLDRTRQLRHLLFAGAKVDIGSHGDLAGLGYHWELELFAGDEGDTLPLLRAATLTGAEKIGADHLIGSIEKGKLADFVVLRDDPLEDIRNTKSIELLVYNGDVYLPETMERVFPDYTAPVGASWIPPAAKGRVPDPASRREAWERLTDRANQSKSVSVSP